MANRGKMSQADRAKQFLPFDALKGFREALAEKERIIEERKELPEEKSAELDRKLSGLSIGQVVTVEYFAKDAYVQITGTLSGINPNSEELQIVDTKIAFRDILEIIAEVEDFD